MVGCNFDLGNLKSHLLLIEILLERFRLDYLLQAVQS